MPYSIEKLDFTAPVILTRVSNPLSLDNETSQLLSELNNCLSGITGDRVYLIVDMSELELSLRELVLALASINRAHGEIEMAQLFHRRVIPLFVESGDLLELIIDSFRNQDFASRKAQTFKTLGGALARVRQLMSGSRPRSLERTSMPCAILRRDIPAPVIRYQLTAAQVMSNCWEQVALDVVTMLAGIEGDSAYLVLEAPKLDLTIAEMTAVLSSTSQPHGGGEIARTFYNRPVMMTAGDNNLHIVVTGLQYGQYGQEYRQIFKLIMKALDQINQAWMVIRTIKGTFGMHLAGIDHEVRHEN